LQAFFSRARDGFGLTTLFCAFAGIGTGGIDQGHNRDVEAVGQVHETDGLTIPFGARHAKVAFDPRRGIVALFMADHHHRASVEPSKSAHNGMVVSEVSVAGKRCVFGEQSFDIVFAMWAIWVPGNLTFPPWREVFVEVFQKLLGLFIKRLRFFFDVHFVIGAPHSTKLFGLAFNFSERFFELEVVLHARTLVVSDLYDDAVVQEQGFASGIRALPSRALPAHPGFSGPKEPRRGDLRSEG
jgi:hypothetical protein